METVMQADSYPSDPIMAGRNKTLESTWHYVQHGETLITLS